MKKVLAICLAMVLVVCMSINVFAARGGFLTSPSGVAGPGLVEFEPVDDDCEATVVISPYGERDTLPDNLREWFEEAYKDIAESDDLTDLNDDLAKIADDKGIDGDKLAVSDLFNIHTEDCDDHGDHVGFDITIAADALEHFVGLLQMNENGVWELVEDAQVVNDGKNLKFSVEYCSPLAIVIDTTSYAPDTSDNSMIYVYAIIMAVCALAVVVIAVKSKKQKV